MFVFQSGFRAVFGFRALFAFRVSVSGVGFGLSLHFGLGFELGFFLVVLDLGCSYFCIFFFPSFSNLDFAHISAPFFFCFFFSSLVLDEFWPQWWRCNCAMVFMALIAVVVVFYIILLCC